MSADWDSAACKGRGELFFGADGETARRRNWREGRARGICARCPIQAACLDYALAERISDGVWGGMTETGRANLLRWRIEQVQRDRGRERRVAA